MRQKFGDYYLGLDIGTGSVGWAVTDKEYNILDFKNKAMWGIHLFNEGETAKKRRTFRTARRRNQRRRQRILLLRELFKSEMDKIDPDFFDRLDESFLHLGDGNKEQSNSLFNDSDFTDYEYHVKFPTIHHLRNHLIKTKEKTDLRLVYLAIHNILKYRGHFLYSGLKSGELPNFNEVFEQLLEAVNIFDNIDFDSPSDIDSLKEVLSDRSLGITDRGKEVMSILDAATPEEKAFSKLISGSKVDLGTIFGEEFKDIKLSFSDGKFEGVFSENEDIFGEDLSNILQLCSQIYNWSILNNLMKDSRRISEAKIKIYDQHKRDLADLKRTVKKFIPGEYDDIFRSEKTKHNYCTYSKNFGDKTPDKKITHSSQGDFCKFILNKLENHIKEGNPDYDVIIRLKNETFMPKQISKDNSAIPYNLNHYELEMILDNASKHHQFLNKADERGFSVKEKILMINKFRVPYYVGPTNPSAEHYWAVRRSDEKITPWNFKDVIDLDSSSEEFIERLTNNCKYLRDETVIPKHSLLYSKFRLYNEVNPIKIDGRPISVRLKNEMVRDLFIENKGVKGVTKKSILSYFVMRGLAEDDQEITGIDDSVKSSLRSYKKLKDIIGDKVNDLEISEALIKDITVFGDDKSRLKLRLDNNYSDTLTESERNDLSKLKFDGWGTLSEKFLTGIYSEDPVSGEMKNIIDLLEETNQTLQEIIHNKSYTFMEQVEKLSFKPSSDGIFGITHEMVDELYISPSVKKGVWRAINVLKDIIKVTGHPPNKIFVETTRGKGKKEKTKSRKESLQKLLKSCKNPEYADLEKIKSEVDQYDQSRFRGRNLYLYYLQHCKCMYCGIGLNIGDLSNKNAVNRDHIYPQSKIVDDSLHNNLVLVCSTCNQSKGDTYPISSVIQNKMRGFWTYLKNSNFISKEKYSRLVRTEELSDDELNFFINRQLVETGQSAKAVIGLLKGAFGDDSDIVYVKAGNVSEFRNEYRFIKNRNVNDYHHAKDAYLNIVVGNVYDTKFTKGSRKFKRPEHYNLSKMYNWDVSFNDEIAWRAGEDGTISTVRKYMNRNNILFTKHSYVEKGKLFNQPSRKNGSLLRIKEGLDPAKYGGYNSETGAYFVLVEHLNKGENKLSIEDVPVHLDAKNPSDDEVLEYIRNKNNYDDIKLVRKIKMNTLFEFNKFRGHLTGRTNERLRIQNGVQLKIPDSQYIYSKRINDYEERVKQDEDSDPSINKINEHENSLLYDFLLTKAKNTPYLEVSDSITSRLEKKEYRDKFKSLSIGDQAITLKKILAFFKCDASASDLSKIGGPKEAGIITRNKKIEDWDVKSIKIVNQSPSGLFETTTEIIK